MGNQSGSKSGAQKGKGQGGGQGKKGGGMQQRPAGVSNAKHPNDQVKFWFNVNLAESDS